MISGLGHSQLLYSGNQPQIAQEQRMLSDSDRGFQRAILDHA